MPGLNNDAEIGPTRAVISGGNSDEVAGLSTDPGSELFVGGSTDFGGSGPGYLIVPNVLSVGGVLAASQGSTITAADIIGGTIGGGGTFDVHGFGQLAPPEPGLVNSVILADGGDYGLGPLTIEASIIDNLGSVEIRGGSTLDLGNYIGGGPLDITPSQASVPGPAALLLDSGLGATIALIGGTPLDLYLPAGTFASSAVVNGSTLDITVNGPPQTIEAVPLATAGYSATLLSTGSGGSTRPEIALAPVCYRRGTRIAVPGGEWPVESLRPGDMVVTASGERHTIKWIGHRLIECRRHPEPRKVWPIRIRAGSFGPRLPARDLYLSPQHAIYAEGVLIPAKVLLNGHTVSQVEASTVEYFHIELDRHEILLAEGLPTESYLDTGDRASFDNGDKPLVLYPDFARLVWDARAFAELKVVGPEVAAVRERIAGGKHGARAWLPRKTTARPTAAA